MPVSTENGVSQSHQPPAYCRSAILMPCTKAPSAIPCVKAAAVEPRKKPQSQTGRQLRQVADPRSHRFQDIKTSDQGLAPKPAFGLGALVPGFGWFCRRQVFCFHDIDGLRRRIGVFGDMSAIEAGRVAGAV